MAIKVTLVLLFAFTSTLSLNLLADTPVKPHSFGGHIASGSAEFNGSSADGDGIVQVYGFYNYGITQTLPLR